MTSGLSMLPLLLSAVLLSAAALKVIAIRRGDLEWPLVRLPGGTVLPPAAVITSEVAAAAVATLVGRPALASGLLAVVFAGLSWAAIVLRGSRCACFGSSGRVGTAHVVLNLLAVAALLAVVVVAPAAVSAGVRTAVTVAAALTIVTVAEWRRRLRRAGKIEEAQSLSEEATALLIVVSEGCGACRSLRNRLRDYPEAWLEWKRADATPEDDWAKIAGHRFPCAVPIDAGGRHVGPARWGVTAILELADQLAVRRITTGG